MDIVELAAIGNGIAAAVFAGFAIMLLTRWKDRPLAGRIAIASGVTTLWAIVQAAGSYGQLSEPVVLLVVESLRNLAWLVVVLSMLRSLDVNRVSERVAWRYGALFMGAGILLTVKFAWSTDAAAALVGIVGSGLMLAALILIITEQIFRNAPFDARSGLRYFCVGVAGIFIYDLVVYSLIIVSDYLNPSQWAARGFVNALFAVPLAFAVHRSFRFSPDKNVPYQFTFYGLSRFAMTIFIVAAFLANYYIAVTGGTLSGVFGILLLAFIALFTAVMIVSPTVRARVRVLVILLRTVGRHVATYIHQAESDRRLSESRQFGTYNRLTAFLMHDLNNLIAQQSLVVKNAEKFRHNPDFVDDAIDTIANSVSCMRRLMEQLSSASEKSAVQEVDLRKLPKQAAKRCDPRLPKPTFDGGNSSVTKKADPEHLIRNAQDATKETGFIDVSLSTDNNTATIVIADDGCGMSPEFIRERLFRPFDSTRGSQSMGIGAYQAREYVRQLGGQIDVSSRVGEGTRFEIRLPTA